MSETAKLKIGDNSYEFTLMIKGVENEVSYRYSNSLEEFLQKELSP